MSRLAAQLALRFPALVLPRTGAVIVGSPPFRDKRSLPRWWAFCQVTGHALAVVFTIGGSRAACADVLYDTSDMIINQTYDWFTDTYIGAFGWYGDFLDHQAADDFELDGTCNITSVTAYYFTSEPTSPAGGVLVEFFEDMKGRPGEVAAGAAFSSDYVLKTFEDDLFGAYAFSLSVDLSDSGISLDPGTWWVSITPVDETPLGRRYRQWRQLDFLNGNIVHGRDGGQDHGNGYLGFTYGGDDWLEFGSETSHDPGDLAMTIEGVLVQVCPADLDGDGNVGAADLLSLLAAWGTDPGGPPDMNGDGTVGAADLLELLADWGPCP